MYKILKTHIQASTVTEKIGINYNVRPTMGFNEETQEITVRIDKVAKPDLTREADVEVTYELLKERTFTVADFPAVGDHNNWIVEYDVVNNIITDPISTWELVNKERKLNPSFTFGNVREFLTARWSEDLIPLMSLKTFDSTTDFSHSVLTFWVNQDDDTTTKYDTVLTNDGSVQLMTNEERDAYLSTFIPKITFAVKNADDESVGTVTAAEPQKTGGTIFNNYTVTLPAADLYKLEITVAKEQFPSTTNTYTLSTINGNINKNRIEVGDGTFEILLNSSGLAAGDYIKFKMNLGEFTSFAELWITFN